MPSVSNRIIRTALSGPKRARSHYRGPFFVVPGRKHYLGGKTTRDKIVPYTALS